MPALMAGVLVVGLLVRQATAMAAPAASATMRDLSLRRARIVASVTLITPLPMLLALGSPMRASRLRVILLPVPAPTRAPLKAELRALEATLAAPAIA